jgi:hypothetical protein
VPDGDLHDLRDAREVAWLGGGHACKPSGSAAGPGR